MPECLVPLRPGHPETRTAGEPRKAKTLAQETHLQVAGRRYYSPGLGRWVSRDPVRELGHALLTGRKHRAVPPASGNPLAYAGGSPIGRIDALGEITIDSSCTPFFTSDMLSDVTDAINTATPIAQTMATGESCYYNRLMRSLRLTPTAAACLAGMSNLTVRCSVVLPCAIPPFPLGIGIPGANSVTLCPGNLPMSDYVSEAIDTIIHEATHACGVWGHPRVDNPGVWAPLLSGRLALPRPRRDDCCFAFDGA